MKKFITQVVLFTSINVFSQQGMPYKNPGLSPEERAMDLVQRMTAEEKFWQLFMIPGEISPGDEDKFRNGVFGFQTKSPSINRKAFDKDDS